MLLPSRAIDLGGWAVLIRWAVSGPAVVRKRRHSFTGQLGHGRRHAALAAVRIHGDKSTAAAPSICDTAVDAAVHGDKSTDAALMRRSEGLQAWCFLVFHTRESLEMSEARLQVSTSTTAV